MSADDYAPPRTVGCGNRDVADRHARIDYECKVICAAHAHANTVPRWLRDAQKAEWERAKKRLQETAPRAKGKTPEEEKTTMECERK